MQSSTFLKFKEISILSMNEEAAIRKKFHTETTILLGGNSSGKSSLIKSLYYGMGAEIKLSQKWQKAKPISLITLSIKGKEYKVLRDYKLLVVFDKNNNVEEVFEDEIIKFSEYWADKLDFKIKLPNKDYKLITPPIGLLFLPYYIDQDNGWTKNWNSVKRSHVPQARKNIIPYHLGIKVNREFELYNELQILDSKLKENAKQLQILKSLLKQTEKELKTVNFDVNIKSFKKEIDTLLTQCNILKEKQNRFKREWNSLQNKELGINEQIKVTEKAIAELNKDYQYVLSIEEESIKCPTCGVVHENSFIERFSLADDENRCAELLQDLYKERSEIQKEVRQLDKVYSNSLEEFNQIQEILTEKQKTIKLSDVIENEGKKLMKQKFENELNFLQNTQIEEGTKYNRKKDALKQLLDRNRSTDINKFYQRLMNVYLTELNTLNIQEKDYKKIDGSIVNNEIGSVVPRMLLAYYFAIFQVMYKYSSTAFCPIIIDSPLQQAPDEKNLDSILKFILKNRPKNAQMILAVETLKGVEYDGKIINMKKDIPLLQKESYKEIYDEVYPLLSKANQLRKKRLFS